MDNIYLDKARAELEKMKAKWQEMSANVQSKVADANIEADRKQKQMQLKDTIDKLEAEVAKGKDAAEDTINDLSIKAKAWMDELSTNVQNNK